MREKDEWVLAQRAEGKTYEQIAAAWFKRCGVDDDWTKQQRSTEGRRMVREASKRGTR